MVDTFYQAKTSEEALEIYLRHDADLYGKVKNEIISKVLDSKIRTWHALKVLEIGAGGGIWTRFFLGKGANVTCVDVCENILRGNAKLNPDAKFILGDAETLEFIDKYDIVFAKDVIEHINGDVIFLKNMNKCIRDGGLIFIITQNSLSLNYVIEGLWNWIRGDRRWLGWDPTHVRFYTPKSLNKKLREAGFSVEQYFGCYHFPYKFIYGLGCAMLRREYRESNSKFWHLIETLNLYNKFPFNMTGWSIGVVAVKVKNL